MGDGREVSVLFQEKESQTVIIETFDSESQNPVAVQKAGWQAILDRYKEYAENQLK